MALFSGLFPVGIGVMTCMRIPIVRTPTLVNNYRLVILASYYFPSAVIACTAVELKFFWYIVLTVNSMH